MRAYRYRAGGRAGLQGITIVQVRRMAAGVIVSMFIVTQKTGSIQTIIQYLRQVLAALLNAPVLRLGGGRIHRSPLSNDPNPAAGHLAAARRGLKTIAYRCTSLAVKIAQRVGNYTPPLQDILSQPRFSGSIALILQRLFVEPVCELNERG